MPETTSKETKMTASSTIASTTRRVLSAALALLLAAAALMALAHSASALQPPGGPGDDPGPLGDPPVARFTTSQNPAIIPAPLKVIAVGGAVKTATLALAGALVQFDGSASNDDDGIAKYQWDLDGNGSFEQSGATLTKTSKLYSTPGIYHVRLRVTDVEGVGRSVEHILIVQHAPRAAITANPTVALVGQQVSYSAAGSTGDFPITKYDWDLDGDGTFETSTATTPTVSTAYTTLGTRNVKVRVRDIHGVTGGAAVNVVVHRAPTAAFTFAPSPAFVGEKVTFDGSPSGDDGSIKDYAWDLDGDGTFETDTHAVATTGKTYATDATVAVKLRVTDDHGVQDIVSHDVRVLPKPAGGAAAADAKGPNVRISPRSVRLSRKGTIALRVTCPAGERACSGRLTLRGVGAKSFRLGGAQTATLRIHVSRKAQRAVKRHHRLRTTATAVARDATGNAGTSRAVITIKR
jgi:PKD repeat protein